MEQLELQLTAIQKKINLLIKQNLMLKKQNETLKAETSKMEKEVEIKDTCLLQLEQNVELLKLNTASFEKADKKLLEKRIDSYLRDIEKCLAQLNA